MSKLHKYSQRVNEAIDILKNISEDIDNSEHRQTVASSVKNCQMLLLLALRADDDEKLN